MASAGPTRPSAPAPRFYTGLAILTSAGVFLFTRIYIPEVILSLFLCTSLYCFLNALAKPITVVSTKGGLLAAASTVPSPRTTLYAYPMWTALALAVLTKGLVALVFFFGTAIIYLVITRDYKKWRALRPSPDSSSSSSSPLPGTSSPASATPAA